MMISMLVETISNQGLKLTLSSLQNEGNTVPTLVLDVSDHGAEGWATRLLGHSVILQISGLAAIQGTTVLTNNDILGLDRAHRAQNTDLLVTDVLGRERDGALHGEQGQNLKKVCRGLAKWATNVFY